MLDCERASPSGTLASHTCWARHASRRDGPTPYGEMEKDSFELDDALRRFLAPRWRGSDVADAGRGT